VPQLNCADTAETPHPEILSETGSRIPQFSPALGVLSLGGREGKCGCVASQSIPLDHLTLWLPAVPVWLNATAGLSQGGLRGLGFSTKRPAAIVSICANEKPSLARQGATDRREATGNLSKTELLGFLCSSGLNNGAGGFNHPRLGWGTTAQLLTTSPRLD